MKKCIIALLMCFITNIAFAVDRFNAEGIYQVSGIKGGVVVHLGCGDGTRTGSLLVNDSYTVQGLGRAPQQIQRARKSHLENSRLGKLSFREYDGVPIQAYAMVLAGKTIFMAGPRDVVDEKAAGDKLLDPEAKEQMRQQDDAYAGRSGALLRAVSTADGKSLCEYQLESLPVFDGMIATQGNLYIVGTDGSVQCMGISR